MCIKTILYKLVQPRTHKGYMTYQNFIEELKQLPIKDQDSVRVSIDGEPIQILSIVVFVSSRNRLDSGC